MGQLARDEVAGLVDKVAAETGIDAGFYKRLIFDGENFGNKTITTATNPKSGASGPAQVLAMNFREGEDASDPITNIRAGARVLLDAKKRYPDNEAAQAAYYNGGSRQGDAVAAGKAPPAKETQDYLKRTGMTTTSTRTTTKTSPYDADIQFALDSIMQATTGFSGRITELDNQNRQVGGAAAKSVIEAGNASAAANQAGADREMLAEGQKQAINKAYSFSTSDPNSDIVDAIARVQDAHKVKNMLAPRLAQMAQTTFLDNPVQWIQDYFEAPKVIAAWQAANSQEKENTRYQESIEARVSAHQRLDPALLSEVIAAKSVAEQKQIVALALAKSAEVIQNTNAHTAQSMMNQASLAATGYNATMSAARETSVRTSTGGSERAGQDEEAKLELINRKRQAAGVQPLGMIEWKGMKPEQRAIYVSALGTEGAYADDPGKSYALITAMGAQNSIAVADQPVTALFQQLRTSPDFTTIQRALMLNEPKFKSMSLDQQTATVLGQLADKQMKDALDPRSVNSTLPAGNPYKFKLENALLTPELVNNPVTAMVKEISIKHGIKGKPVDDLELRDQILAAAQNDPTKVPALAQQLSQFYMVGLQKQMERTGALRLGYRVPTGYGVANWNSRYSGDYPNVGMQMASPTEIEHALNSYLASRSLASSMGDAFGMTR